MDTYTSLSNRNFQGLHEERVHVMSGGGRPHKIDAAKCFNKIADTGLQHSHTQDHHHGKLQAPILGISACRSSLPFGFSIRCASLAWRIKLIPERTAWTWCACPNAVTMSLKLSSCAQIHLYSAGHCIAWEDTSDDTRSRPVRTLHGQAR